MFWRVAQTLSPRPRARSLPRSGPRRAIAAMLLLFALPLGAAPSGELAGIEFVALAPGNVLLRFRGDDLSAVRTMKVQGVQGTLVGIDVRPANRKLYGISDAYALYTIDPGSGKAKWVSALTAPFDGGPQSGFDFNPQADRLRLVGANGQNLRVHVDLGATAVDGALVYEARDPNAGKRPRLVASAYTRSLPRAPETRLFNIDAGADALVLQDPPNDGRLRTIGPLGVDFTPESGFDIRSGPGDAEVAFAATGSVLYRVDLRSGGASRSGVLGDGTLRILSLAVLLEQAVGGSSGRP